MRCGILEILDGSFLVTIARPPFRHDVDSDYQVRLMEIFAWHSDNGIQPDVVDTYYSPDDNPANSRLIWRAFFRSMNDATEFYLRFG